MTGLTRFREAQAGGYAEALAELRAGQKRGHWIWYVFPQLSGLGHSPTAAFYAISDRREAEDYLRDEELRHRLAEITQVALEQLRAGVALDVLMGAHVDALKLVSSLTLFETAGASLATVDDVAGFVQSAGAVLDIAESQGYPRCAFTQRALGVAPTTDT